MVEFAHTAHVTSQHGVLSWQHQHGNVIIAIGDFCNVTRPGGVEGEASFEQFRTGIMVTLIDPRATDSKNFKILISLILPSKKLRVHE